MESNNIETTIVYGSEVISPFFQNKGLYFAATDKGLCRILWPNETWESLEQWVTAHIPNAVLKKDINKLKGYEQQLLEYLMGKRQTFDVPLDMYGTKFRIKVWKALQQIPFGQARSYADIAEAIGNPKAVRAVGTANGANPIPMIVPCHRVIGKNKTLTGFGGGLNNKKKLLRLEGFDDYIDKGHKRYAF
jgi:methylated-DNA-[protein]-cysteine S-methyltransferase